MKSVLILGAGATRSGAMTLPELRRPPLDSEFFKKANKVFPRDTERVRRYFERHYARDIRRSEEDSLEKVMAALYVDVFNPDLQTQAYDSFLALIGVFSRLLAKTTNAIKPSQGSYLYRVITSELRSVLLPENLTIITFNQDIQIEQALYEAARKARYQSLGRVFNFPGSYRLQSPERIELTRAIRAIPQFNVERDESSAVEIIKLHGSLNWFSSHTSGSPSVSALFNSSRKIKVTRRRTIDPDMGVRGKARRLYTFPVVVPPVAHKSGILHDLIKPLWNLAERRLRAADRITVFGYSCPQTDFESAGMISRSVHANNKCDEISLIDPDPNLVQRYVDLTGLGRVNYYNDAADYLEALDR